MSTQLKLRRGTTTEHSTFTGAEGEVTVDMTKDTLVVHDGVTAGGHPVAREAYAVAKDSSTGAAGIPSGTTAQRPTTPAVGYTRFNTTDTANETWNGTSWIQEANSANVVILGTTQEITGTKQFSGGIEVKNDLSLSFFDPTQTYKTEVVVATPIANSVVNMPSSGDVATEDYANSLLVDYTVTGAAVQDITIPGLALSTHKSYRIEAVLISGNASAGNVRVFLNGDTATTNYYTQSTKKVSTSVTTALANDCAIISKPAVAGASIDINGILKGQYSTFNSAHSNINAVESVLNYSGFPGNITSITIYGNSAGDWGIGSRIRIYRGDV